MTKEEKYFVLDNWKWIKRDKTKKLNNISTNILFIIYIKLNYVYLKINIFLMFYFSDINSDHCKNAQSRGVRYWYHHKNKTLNNYWLFSWFIRNYVLFKNIKSFKSLKF